MRNTAHIGEYLSLLEGLQCTPFQTGGLLVISGYSLNTRRGYFCFYFN